MTYSPTVTPKANTFDPSLIDGPWFQRLLPLCNGQRSISEIASRLLLPVQVVSKLVQKASQRGWLDLPEQRSSCYSALSGELNLLFGERSESLLADALQMIRVTPAQLSAGQVADTLIALELLLPRVQAENYGAQFDQLRDTYAA